MAKTRPTGGHRGSRIVLLVVVGGMVVGAGAYLLGSRRNREPELASIADPPPTVASAPAAKGREPRSEETESVGGTKAERAARSGQTVTDPGVKRSSSGSNKSRKPVRQVAIPG